jgi:mRNA interferase MazF
MSIEYTKKYTEWFNLKPKIDLKSNQPQFVKEGNLWWCNMGENIGSEINGKGKNFSRPVIIHTKLSKYTFLVIPCSTQIKEGSWFVKFIHQSKEMIAVLSQIKIIDYRRLENKIGDLDEKDYTDIKNAFLNLYG